MADNELTPEEIELRKQRRRAAMATPVADEGDVAFGAMAGVGVLSAILAAMFVFFGFGSPATVSADKVVVETPPVTEPEEVEVEVSGPDLPAILADLNANGLENLELSANGNVVTARGEVPDEVARATALSVIGSAPNVDEVIDQLTVAEEEIVEVGAAAATVDATDDGIVLSGTVPSEAAAQELRDLAAESYSAAQITDELEVLEGANPSTVTLSGSVTNSALGGALQSGLGGLGEFNDASDDLEIEADASAEINAILELDPILFQSGTAIILPESQPTIDEAIRILNLFPDANVEIGGHTDSLGPDEANRALSEIRAQAVLAALRDGGVSNQLSAVGYGESQLKFPDDKGDTQDKIDARQANRRIEFTTLN